MKSYNFNYFQIFSLQSNPCAKLDFIADSVLILEYKHHLEERDVEIKNLRKQLNEDTRMLKYEYDQLLENERRKARSDLTDLRSSLEKAKREEIDKGSILFLPSPSQTSPV